MRIFPAIAVFLAYAATVVAADVSDTTPALASPSVAETPTASVKGHDPANLSALYTPPPDPVAPVATLSGPVTIGITNRLAGTPALSIVGASNAGVKPPLTPVSGQFSRTTNIVVPSGWAGAFTVDRVGAPFNAQGTRIEGNWGVNDPFNQIYLDISYVTGFSVPIVCSCGANSTAIPDFGCNKELFNLGTCPYGQLQGRNGSLVCVNWSPTSGPPQDFFAPCQGGAYTYPDDSDAVRVCRVNNVQCCLGTACPASANQPSGQTTKRDIAKLMAARRNFYVESRE